MTEETKPQNTIKISKRINTVGIYQIWSSNDFFQHHEKIVFESDEWGCTFRRVSIDDVKTCAVSSNGLNGIVINVNVEFETIPEGRFEIDDSETTEDSIIFNY